MTGVVFEATFDDGDVQRKIAAAIARMANPEPFFKAVGEQLVNSVHANFDAQSGPDGVPWAPLKPSTIRAREKKGQVPIRILRSGDSTGLGSSAIGSLRNSINYEVDAGGVAVGTPMVYGAIHQLGGTIQRPERTGRLFRRDNVTVRAYEITIPARPYLGISAEDEVAILELVEDWIAPDS